MTDSKPKAISGHVVDTDTEITILELCETCCINVEVVDELIEEGILETVDGDGQHRRFRISSVHRTRTAVHLQRDLGLNLAGAALALELLEQIEQLRAELRRK